MSDFYLPASPREQYFDFYGLELDEQRIFDRIEERAENLYKIINESDLDRENIDRSVEELASGKAYDLLHENLRDIVITTVSQAMLSSNEFNYDLYADTLISAVEEKLYDLISISKFSNTRIEVEVDFSSLGSVREWIAAAEAVRQEKGFGKSRLWDIELASHMWAEKIYKVDREGGQVFRKKKKDKKKKKGEEGKKLVKGERKFGKERFGEEDELVDVTSKYKGKYRDTILARLSHIEPGTAPFWEIIENGHKSLGKMHGDGTPYPDVKPVHFLRKINFQINEFFEEAQKKFEEEISKLFEDIIDTIKNKLEDLDDLLDDKTEMEIKSIAQKTQDVIRRGHTQYELFISQSGGKGVRVRGSGGRFVKQTEELREIARGK